MKTIDEILKRIKPEKQKELAEILNIKAFSETKIKEAMLNFSAVYRIISLLGKEEIGILKILYSGNDGISFGDIQKLSNIDINIIEKSVINMSELMIAYVIKNRQMLNKKMDKVHCIKETADIFKLSEKSNITDYLEKGAEVLISNNESETEEIIKDEKYLCIIISIINSGGILDFSRLRELFSAKDDEKKINEMIENGYLRIFNIINEKFSSYIGLSEKILLQAASLYNDKNIPSSVNISNSFKAAANIIKAYDVISSTGLFLTKQNKFRKIDIKKISEAMLEINLYDGTVIADEERAFIAMQMLNLLKCLRLERDIGIINISSISEKIEDPVLIIKSVIQKIHDGVKPADEFVEGFEIPQYSGIKGIISILHRVDTISYNRLKLIFIMQCFSYLFNKQEMDFESFIKESEKQFDESLIFLTICGLCDTINGKINLSELGKKTSALLQNKKHNKETEIKKCIYISPDFTLMIPHVDVDPVSLYTIAAFTEIKKEDVVIEAAITKNSIINAKKRGMNIERFIQTLKKYAKNEIPQNLEFQLNDWTKQTISINISRQILLHTSHGSFLDEILYSSSSKTIMTRISENYAIVDKNLIDMVVKFSKKFDVVITIFEEND